MAFITKYCRIRNQQIFEGSRLICGPGTSSLDVFLDEAIKLLAIAYPKFYKMDRLSKLGFLASEVLLRDTDVLKESGPEGIALVLSNAHASLDTDMRYFDTTRTIASPALFVYTLTNIVMGEISIRHGIKGENAFFITPAFDPQVMFGYVESILKSDKNHACVAGWVDVMGEQHDVFLYLVQRNSKLQSVVAHSPEQLQKLYKS